MAKSPGPIVAGVLLAAGASRRMGRCKQLLELDGVTLLQRAVGELLASSLDLVVVVLRPGLPSPAPLGPRLRVARVPPDADSQVESLQAGLAALEGREDGVLVSLADLPGVTASLVDRLLELFRESTPRPPLCWPAHAGQRGHPVVFRSDLLPELRALPPAGRAADVVARHAAGAAILDLEDGTFAVDVDTPEDWARWTERSRRR